MPERSSKNDYLSFTEDDLAERLSGLARLRKDGDIDMRHAPKFKTSTHKQTTNTKQSRYRKKLQEKGLCARCGNTAFPYNECKDHRESKAVRRALRKLISAGEIKVTGKSKNGSLVYQDSEVTKETSYG
jgi:hypothetical protein